ncbi:MAG TPA: SPASM domain-containing protein [Bacteroidales bacterium]|nr:SPASM domain-containing protein [Bacteroidales bacterium]
MNLLDVRYIIIFLYIAIRTLRLRALWNLLRLRISYIRSAYMHQDVSVYPPSYISIEPTNICNLQCPECPTGNKTSTVAKGYVSAEIFSKVLEACKPYTIAINLYFQGEPFLHPQMCSMISQIHKASIISSVSTNAHYITAENAADIVASGLTHLIVSFDGYNQETYELYRRNGSFQKVVEALEAIKKAKQKQKSFTPIVELQCLLFAHTQNHLHQIRELGNQYGADRVVFKTAQFYSTENMHLLPDSKYSRYTVEDKKIRIKKPLRNACWRMWSSCVINWQGNVLPCCFDKNHIYSYGNVEDAGFLDIWNSSQAQRFKRRVHSQRASIEMCRNCTTK